MPGDAGPAQPDLDVFLLDDHLDGLSDMAERHAITDRIDINKAICVHATFQPTSADGQGTRRQRPQGHALVALEANGGPLSGGAVDPLIGDLDQPGGQVTFQVGEGDERSSGQGIVLDVADAAFDLPLGPRATGTAGLGGQSRDRGRRPRSRDSRPPRRSGDREKSPGAKRCRRGPAR